VTTRCRSGSDAPPMATLALGQRTQLLRDSDPTKRP
jgi:hypothetical protein